MVSFHSTNNCSSWNAFSVCSLFEISQFAFIFKILFFNLLLLWKRTRKLPPIHFVIGILLRSNCVEGPFLLVSLFHSIEFWWIVQIKRWRLVMMTLIFHCYFIVEFICNNLFNWRLSLFKSSAILMPYATRVDWFHQYLPFVNIIEINMYIHISVYS